MGAMACQVLVAASQAAPSVAGEPSDAKPSGLAKPPATTISVPVQAPAAPDRGVSGVGGSWCQLPTAGSYAARSTDPASSQQPARATRTSVPVHVAGLPTGLGPLGMSDHVPTSAGTVVVGAGAVAVEVGVLAVEGVEPLIELPQEAVTIASAPRSNAAARLVIAVTYSRLICRSPLYVEATRARLGSPGVNVRPSAGCTPIPVQKSPKIRATRICLVSSATAS